MTNEEAKEVLAIYRFNLIQSISNQLEGDIEAFDVAIKALEQQPCEKDCISRNEIIHTLNTMDRYVADELTLCNTDEKYPKNEVFIVDDIYELIAESLPSVTPQPNVGKWIKAGEWSEGFGMGEVYGWFYECSECGKQVKGEYCECSYNYCPYCGTKMVESQESEEK